MTDRLTEDLEETASVTLAHTSLVTTLIGVLQNRQLITQADVNEIFDLAMVGLENAEHLRPPTFKAARKVLESMARNMGGEVR